MDNLNKWLALMANFGVVIWIGFLAYETSLTTDAMRVSTAAQQVSTYTDVTNEVSGSPSLVGALSAVTAGASNPTSFLRTFFHPGLRPDLLEMVDQLSGVGDNLILEPLRDEVA